MKKNYSVILILYCFIYLFAPPIIPRINLLLPLTITTIIYMLLHPMKRYNKMLLNKNIVVSYTIYVLYVLIVGLLENFINSGLFFSNFIVVIYKLLILLPSQYICTIFLIRESENKGKFFLYNNLIIAGIIQGCIALLTLIFSPLKELLIKIMQSNTGSDVFSQVTIYSNASNFRFFGFSSTLLDTFGYGMGLLAILTVYVSLKGNKKYLFFLPLILLSIILNSRTGLLIFSVGFFILIFFQKLNIKSLIITLFYLIIIGLLVKPTMNFVQKISPNTIIWIQKGFGNLFNFISGTERSTYEVSNVLFSKNFWTIPTDALSIIFGTGHNIYGIKNIIGFHSDVGYINQFWINGVFGTIILSIFFLRICYRAFKNCQDSCALYTTFIVTFFIMMIKADLLSYNPGTAIFILVTIRWYFGKEKELYYE